jgi:cobaltochelatase CobS
MEKNLFDFSNMGIDELLKVGQQAQEKAVEIAKENSSNTEQLIELIGRVDDLEEAQSDINTILTDNFKTIFKAIEGLENNDSGKVKYLQINEHEPIKTDAQHANFENLLVSIKSGLNVMLVGEAGSGKTTGAHNVAKLLNMNYASISVGAQTGKHEFFGYKDAHGNFIETDFYTIYKNGGLFLIDELDAGNAGVLTSINSALANGVCSFACGMIEKHEDFICIATANTYGNGATMEFIGRNAIDGATLDRFAVIDWNIDENLEAQISQDSALCKEVQAIRRAIKKLSIKHIVSTRGLLNVERLISNGMTRETAFKIAIWKGLSEENKKQVLNNI